MTATQIGHQEGLVLVVGDKDRRGPGPAENGVHVGADACPEVGIEGVEGLVEKDDPRPDSERSGQGDPLLLSTRKLVGVSLGETAEAYGIQQVTDLRTSSIAPAKAKSNIRPRR